MFHPSLDSGCISSAVVAKFAVCILNSTSYIGAKQHRAIFYSNWCINVFSMPVPGNKLKFLNAAVDW